MSKKSKVEFEVIINEAPNIAEVEIFNIFYS